MFRRERRSREQSLVRPEPGFEERCVPAKRQTLRPRRPTLIHREARRPRRTGGVRGEALPLRVAQRTTPLLDIHHSHPSHPATLHRVAMSGPLLGFAFSVTRLKDSSQPTAGRRRCRPRLFKNAEAIMTQRGGYAPPRPSRLFRSPYRRHSRYGCASRRLTRDAGSARARLYRAGFVERHSQRAGATNSSPPPRCAACPNFGDGPVIQCSCPIVAHRLLSVGGDLRPVMLALVPPPVALARYIRSARRIRLARA